MEEPGVQATATQAMLQVLLKKVDTLTESIDETRNEVKRGKLRKAVHLTRKGHQVQYDVNIAAIDAMSAAVDACGRSKVQQATELLNTGIEELEQRNKLIFIADSSEFGWDTADFFQRPDMFDNENEFNKFKAASSLAKAQNKRKVETKERNLKSQRKRDVPRTYDSYSCPPQMSQMGNPFLMPAMPNTQLSQMNYNTDPRYASRFPAQQTRAPVQCFTCANWGHIAANCPQKIQTPASKTEK